MDSVRLVPAGSGGNNKPSDLRTVRKGSSFMPFLSSPCGFSDCDSEDGCGLAVRQVPTGVQAHALVLVGWGTSSYKWA